MKREQKSALGHFLDEKAFHLPAGCGFPQVTVWFVRFFDSEHVFAGKSYVLGKWGGAVKVPQEGERVGDSDEIRCSTGAGHHGAKGRAVRG